MRWLFFMACAAAIAIVYYAGISQDVKALDEGMSSLLSVFTDNSGVVVDSTIVTEEPEEEETIYYLPPGQPKEERDMVYS
jgi:hypothetical protein